MPKYFLKLFLIGAFSLLVSCGTTSHRDGPPGFYVDASRVANATPRSEKLSKYGNYHRYVVLGQAYHTLPSSKNYEEVGIASWYGKKFHKHRTSNGEVYNMLGMTAAHKTLPLPTYVQVTNLKNGKQIIVKVNDRGPFAANRIIDLSYVAAIKLGMIGHGTAFVDVKAIDPKVFAANGGRFLPINYDKFGRYQPVRLASTVKIPVRAIQHETFKRSPVEVANNDAQIYLQLGAFQDYHNAARLQQRLHGLVNTPVKISKLTNHNKDLYHVRIGPFKDLGSANQISRKLKTYGLAGKLA